MLYFWHSIANNMLTLASNMFTDLNLTDMETCYKVFRREILAQIEIDRGPFRIRARDHSEGCEAPDAPTYLRGRDQLFRPYL